MSEFIGQLINGEVCIAWPAFEQAAKKLKSDKVIVTLEAYSQDKEISNRQRNWYKGVCLRDLVRHDENGETMGWWDTEIKRECNGLALLKKEIFFVDDSTGNRIGIGRLTTKGVSRKNMRLFIEEILSKRLEKGWNINPPDPDWWKKK